MKKKKYIAPLIGIISCEAESVMNGASVRDTDDNRENIGYGGSDGPDSGDAKKHSFNVWDDWDD